MKKAIFTGLLLVGFAVAIAHHFFQGAGAETTAHDGEDDIGSSEGSSD